AGSNEPICVHRASLADAMGAIYGLSFNRRIPPRIVKHDVAGRRQVESCSGGPQAQEENRRIGIILESLHDSMSFLGFTGEHVSGNLALFTFRFENPKHLHELTEKKHLLAFGQQWFEQLK